MLPAPDINLRRTPIARTSLVSTCGTSARMSPRQGLPPHTSRPDKPYHACVARTSRLHMLVARTSPCCMRVARISGSVTPRLDFARTRHTSAPPCPGRLGHMCFIPHRHRALFLVAIHLSAYMDASRAHERESDSSHCFTVGRDLL